MATHLNGSATAEADASAAREEALMLLRRLEADRAESEARLVELGRTDPIKDVTGKSALDRAIDEARAMVAALDELTGQSAGGGANGRGGDPQGDTPAMNAVAGASVTSRGARPAFAGAARGAQLPTGEGGFER
jgi:hypothetical protein